VELRLLRYFIAVAEDLHFTRAAARLHISQPSLSHEIRALERTLGTPLFRRTRRWVKLTEAGALLLSEARAIVERTEEAGRRVARAGRGEIGQLNVGFAMSAAGDLLPNAVLAYRARFPEVNVHIQELTTAEQIEALMTDELEVGLVHDVALPPELRAVAVRRDTLVAALPSGHHLAKRARIALSDLKAELFVVGPGQSHHYVVSACASAGFVPQISQETSDTVTCLVLVASGVGVGVGVAVSAGTASSDWAADSSSTVPESVAEPTPVTVVTTNPSSVTFVGLSRGCEADEVTTQVTTTAATATTATITAASEVVRMRRARDCCA